MTLLIGLFINLLLISLIYFLFFKKTFQASLRLLLPLFLLLAPLFHYSFPKPLYNLIPFIILFFLFLILEVKKYKKLSLTFGLLLILVSGLFISNIITFHSGLQLGNSILSNQEIENSIHMHQQDALYLPYKLRPILFNASLYLYYLLTHAFYYLSLSNIYNLLLLANLYPLLLGLKKTISTHTKLEKSFILGSLAVTFLTIGASRSVEEVSSLFIIAPVLIYLIVLGFQKINLKLYLALLIFSLCFQISLIK